uniref:Putative ovule protein n=1 Tax=Solanum chacoense TaxID=4108 RepID=A0A0V0HTK1_SOLCH
MEHVSCKMRAVIRILGQKVALSRISIYTGQWQDGGSTCLISFGPWTEIHQNQRPIEQGIAPWLLYRKNCRYQFYIDLCPHSFARCPCVVLVCWL